MSSVTAGFGLLGELTGEKVGSSLFVALGELKEFFFILGDDIAPECIACD